ncbi:hypothetical protein Vi05172_g13701 [Venturia inaequalis]|nr:hypothetical protein Vi05172_g13701 [Venturia inaequalis]
MSMFEEEYVDQAGACILALTNVGSHHATWVVAKRATDKAQVE